MEKKSMGNLIAALRKANGMTQKDLAERLNVSDKSVSRWERDDGAPDLSLIPVIAEIFDITCDELLRGERKSPAARTQTAEPLESNPKADRQRMRLLKSSLSQFQVQTYIAMGVSVCGLLAACICNLAFQQALLGFMLAVLFLIAAVSCQAIFLNKAFLRVEDAELDEMQLSSYKQKIIALSQKCFALIAALLGFTFPLVLADAYTGITGGSWLLWGSACAAALLLIYAVLLYFYNASLVQKGVYTLSEKAAAAYWHNHRLKRILCACLVFVFAATGLGHHISTALWGPYSIIEKTVFHDYESFITFMEQDIPGDRYGMMNGTDFSATVPVEVPEAQIGSMTYYDQWGNEISEDQARKQTLEDANGTVVCEYIHRNEEARGVSYSPKEGTVLPISVYTNADLQAARQLAAQRHVLFGVVYCIETLTAVIIYYRKRAK